MCKLLLVLFTLSSAVVCNSLIINGYNQPVATSYVTREDDPDLGKYQRYGFSKKYGYNKMIVTTYLTPVPEEVAASYSTYIIHPVDNKRCGYATADDQPIQDSYSKASEDSGQVANFLKMYPIVVEDSDNVDDGSEKMEQSESDKINVGEPKVNEDDVVNILESDKLFTNDGQDGNAYREWFFKEQPKNKDMLDDDDNNQYVRSYGEWYIKEPKNVNVVNDENKNQFIEWFKKREPKVPSAEDWKNFKEQFDSFYNEKFKEFFGDEDKYDDDDEEDDDDDDSEGDNDDEDDEENDEADWPKKTPYEYEYEDADEEDKDKWIDLHRPKYDFNDYDYRYKLWHKW